jgi:hypothetical protein
MLVSPFTFYRGAAKIMAADLAGTPTAGLHVQLCGDAHLSNFGSPERRLLFDLNDLDETLAGPFEYDVERGMSASTTPAALGTGIPGRQEPGDALQGQVELGLGDDQGRGQADGGALGVLDEQALFQ